MTKKRIKKPSPQVAAGYAEEDGNFREAARLYKEAGDFAGGHTHAARMYNKAQECIAKTPDQPSAPADKSAHTPAPATRMEIVQ